MTLLPCCAMTRLILTASHCAHIHVYTLTQASAPRHSYTPACMCKHLHLFKDAITHTHTLTHTCMHLYTHMYELCPHNFKIYKPLNALWSGPSEPSLQMGEWDNVPAPGDKQGKRTPTPAHSCHPRVPRRGLHAQSNKDMQASYSRLASGSATPSPMPLNRE